MALDLPPKQPAEYQIPKPGILKDSFDLFFSFVSKGVEGGGGSYKEPIEYIVGITNLGIGKRYPLSKDGHSFKIDYKTGKLIFKRVLDSGKKIDESWSISIGKGIITKAVKLDNVSHCPQGWKFTIFGQEAILEWHDIEKIFGCIWKGTNYDRNEVGSNKHHKINVIVAKSI